MFEVTPGNNKQRAGQSSSGPISLGCYVKDEVLNQFDEDLTSDLGAHRTSSSFFSKKGLLKKLQFVFQLGFVAALGILALYYFAGDKRAEWRDVAVHKWSKLSGNMSMTLAHVEFEGLKNLKKGQLVEITSGLKGKPLWSIDTRRLRKDIEQFSWVKSVVAERILPDRLKLYVLERAPFALVLNDEENKGKNDQEKKAHLIDEEGQFLQTVPLANFPLLPRFKGAGVAKRAPEILAKIVDFPNISRDIDHYTLVEKRRWNIILKNDLAIWLPENDIRLNLHTFEDLEAKYALTKRNLAVVDLRLKDKITLMRHQSELENKSQKDNSRLVTGSAKDKSPLSSLKKSNQVKKRLWGDKK